MKRIQKSQARENLCFEVRMLYRPFECFPLSSNRVLWRSVGKRQQILTTINTKRVPGGWRQVAKKNPQKSLQWTIKLAYPQHKLFTLLSRHFTIIPQFITYNKKDKINLRRGKRFHIETKRITNKLERCNYFEC